MAQPVIGPTGPDDLITERTAPLAAPRQRIPEALMRTAKAVLEDDMGPDLTVETPEGRVGELAFLDLLEGRVFDGGVQFALYGIRDRPLPDATVGLWAVVRIQPGDSDLVVYLHQEEFARDLYRADAAQLGGE